MADLAPFGERLGMAVDMARSGALRSEIVRATGLSADQVAEIVEKTPGRICDPAREDRDPKQTDLVEYLEAAHG